MAVAPRLMLDGGPGPTRKPKAAQPYQRPPVNYNGGGMSLADPESVAAQRAQARLSSGELAAQQGLQTRLQGYGQSRTNMKDDAEWALRTGAEANMQHLTGQNAINSGLRDRFAERLQGQVNRPLMRNLGNLADQENLARGQTAESIAQLQANLPVMQAEELQRQLTIEGQGITNAVNEASMTGRYMPPAAQKLINQILGAKSTWEQAQGAGDQAGMMQAHQAAEQARASLSAMGVSPNLFGADITRGTAERNVGQAGIATPAARELASALSGVDPMTGQPTLAGRQSNQALAMGDLNFEVSSNPNYGLAAQAQSEITTRNEQLAISRRNAETAAAKAKEDAADKAAKTPKDKTFIQKRWGLSDTGLTTNFAALDDVLTEISGEALAGGTTFDDVVAYVQENERRLATNGVDPAAVLAAARAFLRVADQDAQAKREYLLGEKSQ